MGNEVIVTSPDQLRGIISEAVRCELGALVRQTSRGDDVMDEKEAAAYIRYSADSLRHWRKEGRGPAYCQLRDGGGVRYLKKDLDAWMAGNRKLTIEAPDAPHF